MVTTQRCKEPNRTVLQSSPSGAIVAAPLSCLSSLRAVRPFFDVWLGYYGYSTPLVTDSPFTPYTFYVLPDSVETHINITPYPMRFNTSLCFFTAKLCPPHFHQWIIVIIYSSFLTIVKARENSVECAWRAVCRKPWIAHLPTRRKRHTGTPRTTWIVSKQWPFTESLNDAIR